jgi:RimJ/RimL family protein N-acetyltransferase
LEIRVANQKDIVDLSNKFQGVKNVIWADDINSYLIIAEEKSEIEGFAFVFRRIIPAPVGECYEDFINVIDVLDNKNKGIGTLMVKKIIETARLNCSIQVRAYCDIDNTSSHRLWLKNGFGISPVKMNDGKICGTFVTYRL